VATSKRRRGKDAVDEDLDEILADDDALDSDALTDIDDAATDEDEPVSRSGRTGTAVRIRAKAEAEAADQARAEERVGIFGRLFRFFREVVAELRKVIWPTRKELVTYATVVIVFVTIMFTIVATLDYVFAWSVLHVFGGAKK
jgi:preprotein translocase subunit SecE